MTRFPSLKTHDNLVAYGSGDLLRTDIDVVDESRIIRNYVIKIARMLQCPNDCIVSPLQNSNYTPFAPSSDAAVGCILGDASNNAVTRLATVDSTPIIQQKAQGFRLR